VTLKKIVINALIIGGATAITYLGVIYLLSVDFGAYSSLVVALTTLALKIVDNYRQGI
jgi:hypothetical protein